MAYKPLSTRSRDLVLPSTFSVWDHRLPVHVWVVEPAIREPLSVRESMAPPYCSLASIKRRLHLSRQVCRDSLGQQRRSPVLHITPIPIPGPSEQHIRSDYPKGVDKRHPAGSRLYPPNGVTPVLIVSIEPTAIFYGLWRTKLRPGLR